MYIIDESIKISEFRVEVSMTPAYHDNKDAPYYWVLLGYAENWSNWGCGWAKTPEEAYQAGISWFEQNYKEHWINE